MRALGGGPHLCRPDCRPQPVDLQRDGGPRRLGHEIDRPQRDRLQRGLGARPRSASRDHHHRPRRLDHDSGSGSVSPSMPGIWTSSVTTWGSNMREPARAPRRRCGPSRMSKSPSSTEIYSSSNFPHQRGDRRRSEALITRSVDARARARTGSSLPSTSASTWSRSCAGIQLAGSTGPLRVLEIGRPEPISRICSGDSSGAARMAAAGTFRTSDTPSTMKPGRSRPPIVQAPECAARVPPVPCAARARTAAADRRSAPRCRADSSPRRRRRAPSACRVSRSGGRAISSDRADRRCRSPDRPSRKMMNCSSAIAFAIGLAHRRLRRLGRARQGRAAPGPTGTADPATARRPDRRPPSSRQMDNDVRIASAPDLAAPVPDRRCRDRGEVSPGSRRQPIRSRPRRSKMDNDLATLFE